ncbi:hypothetical protein ACSBR2_013299 [Camellia fascicularis]
MDENFVKTIWPYEEMGFMLVDLEESTGGFFCVFGGHMSLTKKIVAAANISLCYVSGTSCNSFECVIVNIYAPNKDSLVNVHPHYPNPWCVGGDNKIKYMSERKGCLRRDRGMKDFNEFVEKMELTDMSMLGRQYTWCNALERDRWNRIDRFISLLNNGDYLKQFQIIAQFLLKEDDRDWGPKPFKFINSWTSHPTFMAEVKKNWEDTQVSGWAGYRLMRKLYNLRNHLRVWNKEVFGNIDTLLQPDLKAESRHLDDLETKRRREVRSQVWQLSRNKERLWHQKSRLLWARNGDKNTRFFHIMTSRRQRQNLLDSVIVEDMSCEDPVQVKQAVVRHFSQQFLENWNSRPKLLRPFDAISLEAIVSFMVANSK